MNSLTFNRMFPEQRGIIYIIDTNILYIFLEGQANFGHPYKNKNDEQQLKREQEIIRRLFTNEEVIIPQAVMIEMIGIYFHVRIDLKNYDMWYRKRKSVFNNLIIHYLFSGLHRVRIHPDDPGMLAMEISRSKISEPCIKKMRSHYKYITPKSREPKLLDGLDALIVATAMQVATANKNRSCVILSNDKVMSIAVENLKLISDNNFCMPGNIEFKTIHTV